MINQTVLQSIKNLINQISKIKVMDITSTSGHAFKLPIREIFQTSSVWAIWIASIGNMYSIQMIVVFAPIYISQVNLNFILDYDNYEKKMVIK